MPSSVELRSDGRILVILNEGEVFAIIEDEAEAEAWLLARLDAMTQG